MISRRRPAASVAASRTARFTRIRSWSGCSGSLGSAATTLPGATNAQTPSTCPSVSVSSRPPYGSQITLVTPRRAISSASISSLLIPGLRLGCRRHCSVVISVPSPSTVIAPPSRIIREAMRCTPRCSSRAAAILSSVSYGWCLPPQALKRKSTPARCPSGPSTKIGPESRNQESSSGSSTTVTPSPHRSRASAPLPGSATMVTGSNCAIALATCAYSVFTSSKTSPHSSCRVGQAIRQPSCSVHSAGIRKSIMITPV